MVSMRITGSACALVMGSAAATSIARAEEAKGAKPYVDASVGGGLSFGLESPRHPNPSPRLPRNQPETMAANLCARVCICSLLISCASRRAEQAQSSASAPSRTPRSAADTHGEPGKRTATQEAKPDAGASRANAKEATNPTSPPAPSSSAVSTRTGGECPSDQPTQPSAQAFVKWFVSAFNGRCMVAIDGLVDPDNGVYLLSESSWHGTHVAGTIAAATGNALGCAAVAPFARVMPLRVLGIGGGTTDDIVQGILYAAGLPNATGATPARRADVINLSMGGPGLSQATADAVLAARNAGAIVVASAGNDAVDAATYSPAAEPGVVTVGAIDLEKASEFPAMQEMRRCSCA